MFCRFLDFFDDFWSQTKLKHCIQCAWLRVFWSWGWQYVTGAIGLLHNFYAVDPKQYLTRNCFESIFWTILWAKYGTLFSAIVGLFFWFFGRFLVPDKTITLHSVYAAQSLPILRMAACHRSHRIPSQLLCRRSETMSDQTFRKKSWDGTLHCNDTVHTLDFFFFIKI